MAAQETPLQTVKRLYGSKDKLVDSLVGALGVDGEDAGEVKDRLAKISNRKLLRLAEVRNTVERDYGSKDKLVAAVADAGGKAKDRDYVTKLASYSFARLLDMATAAKKRARKAKAN
jgi:hypothetical protein